MPLCASVLDSTHYINIKDGMIEAVEACYKLFASQRVKLLLVDSGMTVSLHVIRLPFEYALMYLFYSAKHT